MIAFNPSGQNTAVSIGVLANDTDVNGSNLATLTVVTAPVNGHGHCQSGRQRGRFSIRPVRWGTDTFSYTVQGPRARFRTWPS